MPSPPDIPSYEIAIRDRTIQMLRNQGSKLTGSILACLVVVWSVVMGILARQVVREPTWEIGLLALPMSSVGIVLLRQMIVAWYASERIMIEEGLLRYRREAIFPLERRSVPLAEITSYGEFTKTIDDESEKTARGLRIGTLGRPIRLGLGLPADELRALSSFLEETIREQVVRGGESGATSTKSARRPSETSLRMAENQDGISLQRPGNWDFQKIFILALLNLFWNGIVAIAFLNVAGNTEGGAVWVFLVALSALAGAGWLLLGLLAVAAPLRSETWRVGAHEVVRSVGFLGWTRIIREDVTGVGAIEVVIPPDRDPALPSDPLDDAASSVRVLSPEGSLLLKVDRLTEGEARWIEEAFSEALLPRQNRELPVSDDQSSFKQSNF